jgi:predicted metal-dependent peptidase
MQGVGEKGGEEEEKGDGICPDCGYNPVDDHYWWTLSSSDSEVVRRAASRAVREASTQCGSGPGHLVGSIDELEKVKINWTREIDMWYGKNCGGRRMTPSRPNRRLRKFGIPGSTSLAASDVTVFVDVSGSMGNDEIKEAFSHIEKIAHNTKILLIQFDDGIRLVSTYRKGTWKKIKTIGGGGTSIIRALKEAEERRLIGHANVSITDGYLSWPEEKPYQMLWYIVSTSSAVPTWGKVVHPG